ncbi:MAG: YceD family protein [Panacagrimonas sp.]
MSIPTQISASRGLTHAERYVGDVDGATLARLSDVSPGMLHAELALRTDVAKRNWLEGKIGGQLKLICQVCLEPFSWSLDAPVALALAFNEDQEERLMADCEPLLVLDDRLMLHEIVEDEVLLALPLMPRCPACENARPLSPEPPPPQVETTRSLATLKDLSLQGGSPARRK